LGAQTGGSVTETREFIPWRINGFLFLLMHLAFGAALVQPARALAADPALGSAGLVFLGGLVFLLLWTGYLILQPNEAKALVFFGKYVGTVRTAGFSWSVPLSAKARVSLRVRNFTSGTLKVNDSRGNPIEIAAVVVWRVSDTARALYDVDHYEEFVAMQAETALRRLASDYPYDAHESEGLSLLGSPTEVAATLRNEIEQRLEVAGVVVLEARLTHLAYAPEIAQAMLRRQQADAVIAARKKIVEGAVGMVHLALEQLEAKGVVSLDEGRKAAMVSNLLVVLTSEQESQPVLGVGGVER
jgi:regulator of protease activity HflC (stomatin/prohibitin superfamily)